MLNNIFYLFLNLTLLGSITAATVLVLRMLFKRSIRKSVFVLLWFVVLFRFSIPLSIPSPTSIFNLFRASNDTHMINNSSSVVDVTPDFIKVSIYNKEAKSKSGNLQTDVQQTDDLNIQHDNNTQIDKASHDIVKENSDVVAIGDIAAAVWIAGMLILVVFGGTMYFITLRKLKDAVAFQNDILSVCKKSLGMKRRVVMLQSKYTQSPFVYGILKPVIVIPECAAEADDKSLIHVLTHELVHIKRFDNLVKLLASLILCVHWYNPVVWLSYILMQRDLEASCDENVLIVLGDNARTEYAFSLYEFASKRYSLESIGVTSFGETSTKSRISNILNYKKSSVVAVIISVCIVVSVVIGYATDPIGRSNEPFYSSKVSYIGDDGLYYTNISNDNAKLLVKGRDISSPVFSNNGEAVAFKQGKDLYVYDFSEFKVQLLLTEVDDYCAGQDDQFYASSQNDGIVAVNFKTAQKHTLVPAELNTSYTELKLSPDYRKLAFYKEAYKYVYNESGQQQNKMYAGSSAWIYDTISNKAQLIVQGTQGQEAYPGGGSLPIPGKWSPESGKIFMWIKSLSASISTDGVPTAVYDLESSKLINLNSGAGIALAYDENVSFSSSSTFAMISGMDRVMSNGKYISLVNLEKDVTFKILETPGKVATTPYYSTDGKMLLFSASPEANPKDEYKEQIATISKRQIYMSVDDKQFAMTNDEMYRSEAPEFFRNNNYISFARVSADGERSVWVMDSDGKNQRKLAGWEYSDPEDVRFVEFYGRIDWSTMYDVYDDTKAVKADKTPACTADIDDNKSELNNGVKGKQITSLTKDAEPLAKSYITDKLNTAYSKYYDVNSIDFKFIGSNEEKFIAPDKPNADNVKPVLNIEYMVTVNYKNHYKEPDSVDYIADLKKKAQTETNSKLREIAKDQYEALFKEYNEVKQGNYTLKCTVNFSDNYIIDNDRIKVMAEDVDGNYTIPLENLLPGKP